MNRIFTDSFIYTIGRILPQLIGFFLLPVYTFYLSTSDYGILNSMQVLSSILFIILTLALDRGVLRLYYDYNTEFDRKEYLGTITISIYFVSTIFLLLFFIFSGPINYIFKSIKFYPFYAYAIVGAYFQIFSLIPLIYLQIKKKPIYFSILTCLNFVIGTLTSLFLVIYGNQGALGILKGILFGNLLLIPIYIYISSKSISLSFNIQKLKSTLRFSLPMIPTLIAAWVLNFSDRVFIEKYFNLEDVAIYSVGAKISGIVLILLNVFSLAYSPYFYEIANFTKKKLAIKKLSKYNNVICSAFIFIIFLVLFFSKEIIELFFISDYLRSVNVIEILLIQALLSIFLTLLNLMYYQSKATLPLMYIFIFGSLINLVLNYLLIPQFSYIGASYATVISFLFMFVIQLIFSKKYFYIKFNWKQILFNIFFLISLYFIFKYYVNFKPIYNIFIKILFTVTLILVTTKLRLYQVILEIVKNIKKKNQ